MQSDADRVIRALTTVPEKRLRLIELVRQLVGPDGMVDHDKATEMAPEVNLAVAEATAYVQATARAMNALRQIPARKL